MRLDIEGKVTVRGRSIGRMTIGFPLVAEVSREDVVDARVGRAGIDLVHALCHECI